MGFFNRFIQGPGPAWPYTNFQQINLDWIINIVKDLFIKTAKNEQDVKACTDYIDSVDDQIQEKINNEIPIAIEEAITQGGFNELLSQSHKRRIVFIGDSYGDGWTPDGTFPNWIDKTAAFLGLSQNDYIKQSYGGAGFGKPSSAGNQYVPNLINLAYQNIANPETVSDVIMGLGYNDYIYANDATTIKNGVNTAIAVSKQRFPNARIHIFAIGFTTDHEIQYKLRKVYTAYSTTLADFEFYNISDALGETALFSTDGIHPLENGQQYIALSVVRGINGVRDIHTYPSDLSGANVAFEMLIGQEQNDVTGLLGYARGGDGRLYISSVNLFKIVSMGNVHPNISGATWTKIAKLKASPYTGYFYPNPYVFSQAVMYYKDESNSGVFNSIPIDLTLAQDQAHNDSNVYLWIQTKDVSGGSFKAITAMTQFGIIGACTELPFITRW